MAFSILFFLGITVPLPRFQGQLIMAMCHIRKKQKKKKKKKKKNSIISSEFDNLVLKIIILVFVDQSLREIVGPLSHWQHITCLTRSRG